MLASFPMGQDFASAMVHDSWYFSSLSISPFFTLFLLIIQVDRGEV